jgi:23S rRNA (guanosine2251-2'-O)-methyltransferase
MPTITLVLHNIRSTHNVGAIFRTAEGFGVDHIVCSGYTPYPMMQNDSRLPHIAQKLDSQIHKTALGAEKIVPFSHYETIDEWIDSYNSPIIALEQTSSSLALSAFKAPETFALVLGEEVEGVDAAILQRCDAALEIPMSGKKESFNVSVANGIALYELTKSGLL